MNRLRYVFVLDFYIFIYYGSCITIFMHMKRNILLLTLLLSSNAFAGFNLGEISDTHYIIYDDEDFKLANIKYVSRSWQLDCVNGVKFGSNYQTFNDRDMAINIAGEQCKI